MAAAERSLRRCGSLALLCVGGLAIVAAVGVLVAGLAGLGGEETDQPAPMPASSAPTETIALADERFGVRLRHPVRWRRVAGDQAVRLTSEDRSVGVTVSTAAESTDAVGQVSRALERTVLEGYEEGQVIQRRPARVGDRPARATAIRARNASGQVLDVLAIAVASEHRTYAIVTFGSPRAPQRALRETDAVLQSVSFSRPRS